MFNFEVHANRFDNNEHSQATCAQLEGEGVVYSVVFNTDARHQTSCVSQVILTDKSLPMSGCSNIQGICAGYNFSRNF